MSQVTTRSENLNLWIRAAGRVCVAATGETDDGQFLHVGGVLRKARPGFFARLFGFEFAPPGDFSESGIARIRGHG